MWFVIGCCMWDCCDLSMSVCTPPQPYLPLHLQYQSKVQTYPLIQGFYFIFYYFLHWPQLWNNTWNYVVTKKVLYLGFLQSSHPLPFALMTALHSLNQLHLQCFSNSLEGVPTCWALVGCFSFTLRSNSSQTIAIGLRSGDCGGQVIWCSTRSLSFLVK
jgi:hypothetical protein